MSDILAVTYDDMQPYTNNQTLSAPAAGFMSQSTGTLTVTTAKSKTPNGIYVLAGIIYPIPFINISLNGTNSGPITMLVATPFKGTT